MYYLSGVFVLAFLLLTMYAAGWEWSTRSYLKGFADAVVPYSASSTAKVEAILDWMARGPARNPGERYGYSDYRDPEVTLNDKRLLAICGTATNAFLNLANSSNLDTRRLLLVDALGNAKHVVVEVYLDSRWIVVDPTFRVIMKDSGGHMLTRRELENPRSLRDATSGLAGYDHNYSYERTTHVRLLTIPLIGAALQKTLESVFPGWDEALNWSLLVERESFSALAVSLLLLILSLTCRRLLKHWGEEHLHITFVPLNEQLLNGSHGRLAVFGTPVRVPFWQ